VTSLFTFRVESSLALYRAAEQALATKVFAEDVALRGGPAELIEAASWWAAENLNRLRTAVYDNLHLEELDRRAMPWT
jgi:hypothetical protein